MATEKQGKRWIEVILMPLAVALVGTLGTYFVTSEQRKSAEIRAAADRQIRIIEIFADKYTSNNEQERLLAIALTGTLDVELSSKILTAIDVQNERSAAVKQAIDSLTQQVIASRVARSNTSKARPGDLLLGRWLLRRQGQAPSRSNVVNWMEFKLAKGQLIVVGNDWQGDVTFDGTRGYYRWQFDDGRTGKTDIFLDETGILYGHVHGSGLDWTYWASREQ